jgi:hypothetical protein
VGGVSDTLDTFPEATHALAIEPELHSSGSVEDEHLSQTMTVATLAVARSKKSGVAVGFNCSGDLLKHNARNSPTSNTPAHMS